MTQQALLNKLTEIARSLDGIDANNWKVDRSPKYVLARPFSRTFTLTVTFDEEGKAYFLQSSTDTSLTYATLLLKWRIEIDKYNKKI